MNFLAAPVRLLDTRTGGTKLASGATRVVQVTGARAGIPAGAVGVVGNLAVTATDGSGYLTVYPQGAAAPTAANLNWVGAGQTLSNAVVVGLNAANGQMTIHNGVIGGSSATHVIFDVAGFVY